MKAVDFFSGRMVLGVLVVVLLGSFAAQSEENQTTVTAADTHQPPDRATNSVSNGSPTAVDTHSAYGELVRLVQAGVDQSVISTYIENSLRFFNLDADRIIYLTDLGVPSEIIEAAMEHDKRLIQKGIAPAEAASEEITVTATNPPPEVTVDYFYDTLAPYGSWVYVEGYGRCWRPTVVTYHAGWRPYCDNGRWVYTDYGWYWMSDYSWGWATFHYGRWFRHDRYGWCWWPHTVWAPSWVSWRYDRTYCGWAPLPPYTSYRSGVGIVYRGSRVRVGFNFGLDSDSYVFVATRNLCDPKPRRHCIDRRDAKRIYGRTKGLNRIDYDARKRSLVNSGISPNIISTLSGQDIKPVSVRHAGSRAGINERHERLNRDRQTLVVSRPQRAVTQSRQTPARRSSRAQQTAPPQKRSTYVATEDRHRNTPGHATVRKPEARMQRTRPSSTRQPSTASQARQQRPTPPPAGMSSQRPAARRPAAPSPAPQARQRRATPPPAGTNSQRPAARRPASPSPAPQARQQRPTSPPAATSSQRPATRRPAAPSRDHKGPSVSQGNHSSGAVSRPAQAKNRNARPNGPPSGKSSGSAPGNRRSTHGRPDGAGGGK